MGTHHSRLILLLGHIEMYHVYVDGFLRTTVRSTDKTKALVEGVDGARVGIEYCKIRLQLISLDIFSHIVSVLDQ